MDKIDYLGKCLCINFDGKNILVIGDLHLGYEEILNEAGVFVTREMFREMIVYFDRIFEKNLNSCGEIIIVKGNHDRIIGPIANSINARVSDYFIIGEYCFVHGDRDFEEMKDKKIRYWIMGHGHPAVKLGDGIKLEKYKCFLIGKYKGKEIIIVPSFLEYNEGSDPRENDLGMAWKFNYNNFEVKIVDSEELKVFDFGKLWKLGQDIET